MWMENSIRQMQLSVRVDRKYSNIHSEKNNTVFIVWLAIWMYVLSS